jgi:hypothetical protein
MTERPANEAQPSDEPGAGDSDQGDGEDGGTINDPLTRRDVEAPRVPFRSNPSEDDD